MKWLVKLTGDNPTLETLCQTDSTDDFRIEKIDKEFLLSSKSFETCQSNSEVLNLTSDYLEVLNGMLFLQYGLPKAIQVGLVYRINEKGGRDIFIIGETA